MNIKKKQFTFSSAKSVNSSASLNPEEFKISNAKYNKIRNYEPVLPEKQLPNLSHFEDA
jgi:hypothetical protein